MFRYIYLRLKRDLFTMYKLLAALLLFLGCFLTEAKQNKLVACVDEHPPYQYIADVPYGKHITALEILAEVLGKQLTFVKSPNIARCLSFLNAGSVDVIAGLNITKQRQEFTFYAPFKLADQLTAVSKKNITINKYSDFKGKIIGVPRGATYFAKFDNDDTLNKVAIQNEIVGLSMILKNRIDFMLGGPELLNIAPENEGYKALKASKINLQEDFSNITHFGFSVRNKLAMSQEEITSLVKEAFEKGRFKLPEQAKD
jgi:polar amino acid transport system substrate-binding protein